MPPTTTAFIGRDTTRKRVAHGHFEIFELIYIKDGGKDKKAGDKPLEFTLNGGHYKVTITNRSKQLFGKPSFLAEIHCGDFRDVSPQPLGKAESWTSSFSVPPNECAYLQVSTRRQGGVGVPFRVEVFKRHTTVFRRRAGIAMNEKNTYHIDLQPGLYYILATINTAGKLRVTESFRLRYELLGVRGEDMVTGQQSFLFGPFTVLLSDRQLTGSAILTIELTGATSNKLVTFNIKVMQSIGVQAMKKAEDDEKAIEKQSFKLMIDEALQKQDLSMLQMLVQITQTKGYINLCKYGRDALHLSQDRKRLIDSLASLQTEELLAADSSSFEQTCHRSIQEIECLSEEMDQWEHAAVDFARLSSSFSASNDSQRSSASSASAAESGNRVDPGNFTQEKDQIKLLLEHRKSMLEECKIGDGLSTAVEQGDVLIVKQRITVAETFLADHRDCTVLPSILEKAKRMISRHESFDQLLILLKVAMLKKDNLSELRLILAQLLEFRLSNKSNSPAFQETIVQAKQIITDMERIERLRYQLAKCIVELDAGKLAFFLDLHGKELPDEVAQKARRILELLLQKKTVDASAIAEFLRIVDAGPPAEPAQEQQPQPEEKDPLPAPAAVETTQPSRKASSLKNVVDILNDLDESEDEAEQTTAATRGTRTESIAEFIGRNRVEGKTIDDLLDDDDNEDSDNSDKVEQPEAAENAGSDSDNSSDSDSDGSDDLDEDDDSFQAVAQSLPAPSAMRAAMASQFSSRPNSGSLRSGVISVDVDRLLFEYRKASQPQQQLTTAAAVELIPNEQFDLPPFDVTDSLVVRQIRMIGRGSFGEVWEIFLFHPEISQPMRLARKTVPTIDAKLLARAGRESNTLQKCRHDNVVNLRHWTHVESQNVYHIFMDLMDINVGQFILQQEDISEHVYRTLLPRLLLGIANGLQHMHAKGIVNLNMKPANVLLNVERHLSSDEITSISEVRLSDIGTSVVESIMANGNSYQATHYTAPEVKVNLFSRGEQLNVGVKADVYSFGIILGECMMRQAHSFEPISHGVSLGASQYSVVCNAIPFSEKQLRSRGLYTRVLCDLYRQCTRIEPSGRPTMSDVLSTLRRRDAFVWLL